MTNDGINATISHYNSPALPYDRGYTFLQIVPVWFSTGIVLSVFMPLFLGITVILEPVFSKENFARDIKKHAPNMILGATSLWVYAASCPELKGADLSQMYYPITGGEQVLPKVEEKLNGFLKAHGSTAVLLKGYGMCELGSTVTSDSVQVQKRGAMGFPIARAMVAAFDQETNQELKYYERGEIRVCSPARMKEYFQNPEATSQFFYLDERGNAWGRTGDIGYVDEDGFVYILGRATDTYFSKQNRKVYCFDIENVILKNSNVAQCEVVGIPRGEYEVPVAHIVWENSSDEEIQEALNTIHEDCMAELDTDCVPWGYRSWVVFPVKNSGKRNIEQIRQERTGFVIPDGDKLKAVVLE